MTTNRQRLPLLDGLRGFSLLSMAGFHLVWDLIFLCGRSWLLEYETALYLWQQSICWSFIFLSGFSWPLSRRPVRRGAVVFFCGAVITAASCAAMPMNPICFGILTFLGSAMILLQGLHPLLRRLPAPAGLAGSLLLFFLLRGVNDKALGFPPFFAIAPIPDSLYQNLFTAYLGFPPENFLSLDYFSLLPWLFLYLAGYFFHCLAGDRGWLSLLCIPAPSFLTLPGRYSLLFYLVHQPVLIAGLLLYHSLFHYIQ